MRDPRHPRHFTDEFKRQIVDLYNAGKPKREIMDEYDLGKSTVERWIKSINATGSPRAADNRTPEQNRILELERENRRLRMEVDVLRRAAPAYARKSGPWRPTGGPLPHIGAALASRPSDLCQDFGRASSRNQAAIGMASGLGSVLSKKAAMASAGTL